LAEKQKICANVEFPFPRSLAYRIFRALNPDLPVDSPWDPEVLLWRIVRTLPSLLERKEFSSLQNYVSGDNAELRLYQLAGKIAHTFDQYVVYRPELLREWEQGAAEGHWQAVLWRELVGQTEVPHGAQLLERTLRSLQQSRRGLWDIPQRLSLFGISVLPKFYLDVFAAIAGHREVNLFLIQPTQESWDHITSRREGERIADKANLSASALHLEEGHPLLASWGGLGREFFGNILEFNPEVDDPAFSENSSSSLLHRLQNDILFLNDRSEEKGIIAANDTSIQVHSCHSPIRELEVLRDQMLSWFAADKDLHPRDILVMMPDVESYSPFIQAIFDVPESKNERIPFSIADRSVTSEGRVAETLLTILDLPERRCGSRQVLSLFDCRSLLARYDLAEEHLELIER
ncbi:MAG: exodeoxyribonuclease V subunit gamma, partial [Limisphaerales bacterium]